MFQLLLRARTGDAEAQEELLVRVVAFATPIIRRRLGGLILLEEAEEIGIDTAMYVNANIFSAQAQNERQFRTWVARIAIHRTIDALRRTRSHERIRQLASAAASEVGERSMRLGRPYSEDLVAGDMIEMIQGFVEGRNRIDQDIVRLRFFKDLEWEEVGHQVGLKSDAARIRFYRLARECISYLRDWVRSLPPADGREVLARFPILK